MKQNLLEEIFSLKRLWANVSPMKWKRRLPLWGFFYLGRRDTVRLIWGVMLMLWVLQNGSGVLLQAETVPPTNPHWQGLPQKPFIWDAARKLEKAIRLRNWTVQHLEAENAQLGLVARQGPWTTRFVEQKGLTHMGLVFKSPATGEWITYSLYSDPATRQTTALLWQQGLTDFFYGQRHNGRQAMLLIPKPAIQTEWLRQVYSGPWHPLLPVNHHYNLLAPLQNPLSINCTKWIAWQYLSAETQEQDIKRLSQTLKARYGPLNPPKRPNLLMRWALKRKRDVKWDELSPPGEIQTVTAEGLYESGWFEKRFFFQSD